MDEKNVEVKDIKITSSQPCAGAVSLVSAIGQKNIHLLDRPYPLPTFLHQIGLLIEKSRRNKQLSLSSSSSLWSWIFSNDLIHLDYDMPVEGLAICEETEPNKSVECPSLEEHYIHACVGKGTNSTVWLVGTQASKTPRDLDRVIRVSFADRDKIDTVKLTVLAGRNHIGPMVHRVATCTIEGVLGTMRLILMTRLDMTLQDYLIHTKPSRWDITLDSQLLSLFRRTAAAGFIVHDCKPDNIMVHTDPDNHEVICDVYLIDFEFAYSREVHGAAYDAKVVRRNGFDGWTRLAPDRFASAWDLTCLTTFSNTYLSQKLRDTHGNVSLRSHLPQINHTAGQMFISNPELLSLIKTAKDRDRLVIVPVCNIVV